MFYLIILLVGLTVAVVNYIFRGIGMYNMAKREGMDYPWLAFVPFARTYLQGELGGTVHLKNKQIKNPGIWLIVLPFISSIVTGILYVVIWVVLGFGVVFSSYGGFSFGAVTGIIIVSYLMFYAIAVVIIMWVVWNRTTLGKNMFAIGGNREAAKVCGVNVKRTIIIVYVIAGILYAFGGVLEAGRTGSANSTMGADYAMDAIAACVVGGVSMKGGTGTLPGVVVGVIIFQIITYGLIYIGVSPDLQYVVKGLIIIIAVVLDNQKSLRKAA